MSAKRRASFCSPNEFNRDAPNLAKSELDQLGACYRQAYKLPSGGISFYDMIQLLKECRFKITEQRRQKFLDELAQKQVRVLDFGIVERAASRLKKEQADCPVQASSESQFLDSFVALGGIPDKSGFVSKQTLITVIKNEFELTLDIEDFLEGLEGIQNERLNFDQFCEVFQGESPLTSSPSSHDITKKIATNFKTEGSITSLQINQQQFQKYWQKITNQVS